MNSLIKSVIFFVEGSYDSGRVGKKEELSKMED